MGRLFKTIRDLNASVETIRQRSYGAIEVADGKLVGIHLRAWPKLISGIEAWWADGWGQQCTSKNRAIVYYAQPMAHRNYLNVSYVVTTLSTDWKTGARAMAALDFVAYAKRSDAILAEVHNKRISNRLMGRLGWEQQNLTSRKRHWIKRFYGDFPPNPLFERMGLKHPVPDPAAIVATAFGPSEGVNTRISNNQSV